VPYKESWTGNDLSRSNVICVRQKIPTTECKKQEIANFFGTGESWTGNAASQESCGLRTPGRANGLVAGKYLGEKHTTKAIRCKMSDNGFHLYTTPRQAMGP